MVIIYCRLYNSSKVQASDTMNDRYLNSLSSHEPSKRKAKQRTLDVRIHKEGRPKDI